MKYGDLRGILQYVPQFRGRTFVVVLDGDIVASKNFSNILLDLAVLRSLNVKIVLVHGAGVQIRALAEKRGITASKQCSPVKVPTKPSSAIHRSSPRATTASSRRPIA